MNRLTGLDNSVKEVSVNISSVQEKLVNVQQNIESFKDLSLSLKERKNVHELMDSECFINDSALAMIRDKTSLCGQSRVNRTGATSGSIASNNNESENESDSRPFEQQRVNRQKAKRRERSSNDMQGPTKRYNGTTSYSSAINRPIPVTEARTGVNAPSSRNLINARINQSKTVGKAVGLILKAADPVAKVPVSKSVYCISNVDPHFSVNDIREHCKYLKLPSSSVLA